MRKCLCFHSSVWVPAETMTKYKNVWILIEQLVKWEALCLETRVSWLYWTWLLLNHRFWFHGCRNKNWRTHLLSWSSWNSWQTTFTLQQEAKRKNVNVYSDKPNFRSLWFRTLTFSPGTPGCPCITTVISQCYLKLIETENLLGWSRRLFCTCWPLENGPNPLSTPEPSMSCSRRRSQGEILEQVLEQTLVQKSKDFYLKVQHEATSRQSWTPRRTRETRWTPGAGLSFYTLWALKTWNTWMSLISLKQHRLDVNKKIKTNRLNWTKVRIQPDIWSVTFGPVCPATPGAPCWWKET